MDLGCGEIDRHRCCWRREVHRQAAQLQRPPAPCHPPNGERARAGPAPKKLSFAEPWTVGPHPKHSPRRCGSSVRVSLKAIRRLASSCRRDRRELAHVGQLVSAHGLRSRRSPLRWRGARAGNRSAQRRGQPSKIHHPQLACELHAAVSPQAQSLVRVRKEYGASRRKRSNGRTYSRMRGGVRRHRDHARSGSQLAEGQV